MAFNLRPDPNRLPDTRPLYERVQDWVFQLDMGAGIEWFRLGLFSLLVLFVVLLYTGTRFYGLRDAEAMDLGQLGRNLARGEGYVTQNLRPLALWHLNQVGRPLLAEGRATHPELWTPPGYPFVLGLLFRLVNPNFEVVTGTQTLAADRLLMVIAWLFFLLGLVLTYFLAQALFDRRVATLSAFLYLFSDPFLDAAIGGLPVHFLAVLFLVAVYGLYKAEQWQLAGRSGWWVNGAVAASAAAVGCGTLTRYAFAAVLGPLLVYVAVSFPASRWRKVGLCLAVFLAVLGPWVARNWRVSRTWFGLAKYEIYEDTGRGTDREIRPGQLQSHFGLDTTYLRARRVLRKMILNQHALYEGAVKQVGANYLIAFFLAALLHRFRRDEVFRLRRFVFWSLLAAVAALSAGAPPRWNFLNIFLPLIIVYGAAFFLVLFERLQFRTRLLRQGMVVLFVGLNAAPLVFTLLPPVRTLPYPPYDGAVVTGLGRAFREDEVLLSDVPAAVAWYADRGCIWRPDGGQEFIAINDQVRAIAGIYLTQETFNQLTVLQLVSGQLRYWLQLYQPPPPEFPLQAFQAVTPDGQQVLLSNRRR
jgi:hypothetical protein